MCGVDFLGARARRPVARLLLLSTTALAAASSSDAFGGDLAEAVTFAAEVMGPSMHMTDGYERFVDADDPMEAVEFLVSRRIVPGLPLSAYPLRSEEYTDDDDVILLEYERELEARDAARDALTYQELLDLVSEAASVSGLPPALIDAVIQTESGYRIHATSGAGALGLMQLMPRTAEALGVTDPLDPRQNVLAGALYLRSLYDRFGSLRLALAAYNAGPTRVARLQDVPDIPETRAYVKKVLQRYETSALR
ncbi:MAG: lytic transglycosylase domain-containing protein [Deltaproteobacteria bacterium]|nr:lytic transglycosylase domain-containing protein [Deltaproteobacteria bacterium]